MIHEEYQWLSYDKKPLFAQSFLPDTKPKYLLSFVHGIGEYSSRYYSWFERFANRGVAVFAIDYRGHGRSFGKRGEINRYEDVMEDISTLLEQSKAAFPLLPHFLYGHSLGGHLVLSYTANYHPQLAGLVVGSPWLILPNEPPKYQIIVARFLHRFWPSLRLSTPLKAADISSAKDTVQQYEKDPLMHNKISLELFFKAQDNNDKLLNTKNLFPLPVALFHGSDDRITSPKGSRLLAANNGDNIRYKEYPKMYHELHNDLLKEELFADIMDFIETGSF